MNRVGKSWLDKIVEHDDISKIINFVIYTSLSFLLVVNLWSYIPYFLQGTTDELSAKISISLIIESIILLIIYKNGKDKYFKELVITRSVVKSDLDVENIDLVLQETQTRLRLEYLGKTVFNMIVFSTVFYIIYFGNTRIRQFAIILFIGYSIIYYNTQKVDPQEVKDSMKYDRQLVDLDGGIAASAHDMQQH